MNGIAFEVNISQVNIISQSQNHFACQNIREVVVAKNNLFQSVFVLVVRREFSPQTVRPHHVVPSFALRRDNLGNEVGGLVGEAVAGEVDRLNALALAEGGHDRFYLRAVGDAVVESHRLHDFVGDQAVT